MLLDPLEHELAERLAEAGERARSSKSTVPNGAFAADLRDRLMTQAAERELVGERDADRDRDRGPRTGLAWSLPSFFRVPRLVPVAVAAVLMLAGVVAARELYVALGNRPDPTPAPSVEVLPTASGAEPSLVPIVVPTATDSSAPTSAPPAEPTVKPTPKPTAVPTAAPIPGPAALSLTATGCEGGVVLNWSQYAGDLFNHYTTLRNVTSSIPMAYPPQGGAVDPGGTYATDPGLTSAVDVGVVPGVTYYYRAMAFNADDGVIGASSVTSAKAKPGGSLGTLGVSAIADGTQLSWTPYVGLADCFTWYKLAYSETNPSPSYLGGDSYLAAIPIQATGSYVASAAELVSGHTYYLRVQAIRGTELGGFLVAETDVATYLVP